jgi:hypothetical protein
MPQKHPPPKDQGNFGANAVPVLTSVSSKATTESGNDMTRQATDSILINKVKFPLHNTPLSRYLAACAPRLEFGPASSFNWRAYVAHWAIQDGGLYLNEVSGALENGELMSVKHLFPFAVGPVPAIWCNETLTVPSKERAGGKLQRGGYEFEYQTEMLISIESGRVTKILERSIPLVELA